MTDPAQDIYDVCLELSEGLRKVGETMGPTGSPLDTGEAMIALGPLFERFGTMRRLPVG